jgi:hypothetical protein
MLLTILFQRGICIMGPKIRGFWAATPPDVFNFLLDPQKALPYVGTRVLSHQP